MDGDLKPTQWLDAKVKGVTSQMLADSKEALWPQVVDGMKELAHLAGKRGLTFAQFLGLRKELIQTMELYQPLARTNIEVIERNPKIVH